MPDILGDWSDLLVRVADDFVALDVTAERQLEALEGCLSKLAPTQRELLDSRYTKGEPVNEIAMKTGRDENVVSASLYRIRRALMKCVEATLGQEVRS